MIGGNYEQENLGNYYRGGYGNTGNGDADIIRCLCIGCNKVVRIMPLLPWRNCPVAGCPELVRSGRCEKHSKQQKQAQAQRRHNDPRYNTMRWQRLRDAYRTRNPLCERCVERGITKAVDMVHHIRPISKGGDMWAWYNLESICFECHGKAHGEGD